MLSKNDILGFGNTERRTISPPFLYVLSVLGFESLAEVFVLMIGLGSQHLYWGIRLNFSQYLLNLYL